MELIDEATYFMPQGNQARLAWPVGPDLKFECSNHLSYYIFSGVIGILSIRIVKAYYDWAKAYCDDEPTE